MGRNSEAIAEMRTAENLDPLSLMINADLAELLLIARFSDQSIQQSWKTIDMDPSFAVAHYDLGQALVQKHMYSVAMAELETATKLAADSPICKSTLAYAYAVSGRRNEALKILNDLIRQSKDFPSAAENALIYTGLGENDRTMAWLEIAYSERFNLPSSCGRP